MSYMVGYGPKVWTARRYYFWVPTVVFFTGCTSGGFLYDVFMYTCLSPIIRPDKAKEIDGKYVYVKER
jgi:aquaglyceroporin related protein